MHASAAVEDSRVAGDQQGLPIHCRQTSSTPDRLFYTTAGAIFLVLTIIGFRHYIFGGRHFDSTPIDPSILATVVAHSSSIFAWYVLFFVQSLLISTRKRRLHMKLGWSVLVIASTIALTGPIVAIRSLRLNPNGVPADWTAPQFLLIMYGEIAFYVAFVAIGVLNRKQPRIHRPMMLLACLSILSGATGRIPLVNSIFGLHTWMALFGPVVSLGALLLFARMVMIRRIEREFVLGYVAFAVLTVAVSRLAVTNVWVNWAGMILRSDGMHEGNAVSANINSGRSEMDEVRETERHRLRALVSRDIDAARPLHADDFQLINPLGGTLSKEQYLGAVAAGEIHYLLWQPESIEVRLYGDLALIRYRSQIEIVVQGRMVPRQHYWHTDAYEKRGGQWQVVWSQATAVTDLTDPPTR
jgi:hypothetical protein